MKRDGERVLVEKVLGVGYSDQPRVYSRWVGDSASQIRRWTARGR